MTGPTFSDDADIVKDHRPNARTHDVRRPGCAPTSEPTPIVVRAGHIALDRALARAAARNATQSPVGSLRAAHFTAVNASASPQLPSPERAATQLGQRIDGISVTASRDDRQLRVVHVATVRDVPSPHGWCSIRTWRELANVSAN